ncbi:transposase [Kitasatospora sp. NPDC059795]|uniref:transposase n=1 Tax=Kitasatospora sp. NPDC059795 TaxID=3346949 RepID=UPI00365E6667
MRPPLDRLQATLVMAVSGQPPGVINEPAAEIWDNELGDLFLRVGRRFSRVEPRRRMRDYVSGLLGAIGRKNGWQLAEYAGHATPYGLQHLPADARWDADEVRDELQHRVAEHLGESDGVLIIDDTSFVKKGTTSACGGLAISAPRLAARSGQSSPRTSQE